MATKTRQILDMNAFVAGRDAPVADSLVARRLKNAGASSVLFYEKPIEMKRGAGSWLEAADGTRYLDFYNNVPSVGHNHPGVVSAIQKQIGELNINSRYLHPVTEQYLERLIATLPASLSNVTLACTGSEANDLALRIASAKTGGTGFVVTETAYHGNTSAVTDVSPSIWKRGKPPAHVKSVPAPSYAAYGEDVGAGFAKAVRRAITTLRRRGHEFAGLICDTIFSSDGVYSDPPGFLADVVATTHAADGLFIADEVQPGFGRTGHMWGFERHGVEPDIVTMGKPMGNGYPVSGLATRPELLSMLSRKFGYFNTFGGTPVAAAAGLSVLDAIRDEGLRENATYVGKHLLERLRDIKRNDDRVTEVRGAGLFLGVDLCGGKTFSQPSADLAQLVINGLRDRQILIGCAGPYGHTLKIRPPLCLTIDEADVFADALVDFLAHTPDSAVS